MFCVHTSRRVAVPVYPPNPLRAQRRTRAACQLADIGERIYIISAHVTYVPGLIKNDLHHAKCFPEQKT